MHFSSIYRQQPKSTPRKWMSSVQLEKIEKEREALEKLKELAAQAEDVTVKRAAIMKELQNIAAHTATISPPAEADDTALMHAVSHAAISSSTHLPTSYKNPTVSPWVLVIAAIIENRRYANIPIIPKSLYVSDRLLEQLGKDMKYLIEEEFNGKNIPFTQLNGDKVYIPIFSAQRALGVFLPNDVVWCAN